MKGQDEEDKKRIKVYKTLLGLNQSEGSNLTKAQEEVKYISQLTEMLLKASGGNLGNSLIHLMNTTESDQRDEN